MQKLAKVKCGQKGVGVLKLFLQTRPKSSHHGCEPRVCTLGHVTRAQVTFNQLRLSHLDVQVRGVSSRLSGDVGVANCPTAEFLSAPGKMPSVGIGQTSSITFRLHSVHTVSSVFSALETSSCPLELENDLQNHTRHAYLPGCVRHEQK